MRICWVVITPLLTVASVALPAADTASMQAAVVTGGTVRVQTVPRPAPVAGEVLVQLQFASVNPADWKRASGKPEDPDVGQPRPGQPQIPGMDGAGVVTALGPGVTRVKVGEPVLLWSRHGGTYAQYVAVAASAIAPVPDGLPIASAAAIPHAGLAAWNLLIDVAKVHLGQRVVVLGGAGGVGSAGVQIARIEGAHVTATASAGQRSYLRQIGAEAVIDYTTAHFEEQLRDVDIVFNTVDADNAYRGLAVVKHGGYLLSVAGLPLPAQCAGRAVICAARNPAATSTRQALEQMADWARDGRFFVNIDRTFGLNEVLQAWAYSQAGHTRGKVVLHVGG